MRILSTRSEYLIGILPTMPISDVTFSNAIFSSMELENRYGSIRRARSKDLIERLISYFEEQLKHFSQHPGYQECERSGGAYILNNMRKSLDHLNKTQTETEQLDWLDSA